jgi:hypothetical protein
MRLRAQIVVDFNAEDYVEAATHQRTLEQLLDHVRGQYPNAHVSIRERRERKAEALSAIQDSHLVTIDRARSARRS